MFNNAGQNQAIGLFAYAAILDAGALILCRYRPWVRILMGSFLGTLILYSAWHAQFYSIDQFWTAMISISLI